MDDMREDRCFYCGVELLDYAKLRRKFGDSWAQSHPYKRTNDHKRPRSRGGARISFNLIPACQCCNGLKENRTLEEFRSYVLDAFGITGFFGEGASPEDARRLSWSQYRKWNRRRLRAVAEKATLRILKAEEHVDLNPHDDNQREQTGEDRSL